MYSMNGILLLTGQDLTYVFLYDFRMISERNFVLEIKPSIVTWTLIPSFILVGKTHYLS